ncbi:molecular chaperone [Rosenbergiella australiborealis]|uniref:fimbrial biogenesis chaperone n=1 Tax=Rosenbergiella australiborealis TaxID=1544696 RepID=UPI001F4ECA53|nr:molecular chaperone [Rosenbergiella australiborealis]
MKLFTVFSLFWTLLLTSMASIAGNSLLVWPILQVIEADQTGSALWLENHGTSDIHLQVRVFSWQQRNDGDHFSDQSEVVASPPFIEVAPRQKQLIRLIRTGAIPSQGERAYRIVLDQLPDGTVSEIKESAGLHLQMRYVLPLFTYANGVWTKARADKPRDSATATQPKLSWRIETIQGKRLLTITNQGVVHARLTSVFFGKQPAIDASTVMINKGLLGYVLAGSSMSFPIGDIKSDLSTLQLYAKLDDNGPIVAIR